MTLAVQTDFHYDEEEAERAVDFFSRFLRHVKGEWAGQPLELAQWQLDEVIRPLFGWRRPDGTRRYRMCYIEVPKKQGKSTLAAGIGLYLTFADGEPGAEIYSAASDRDQAAIVFDLARQMVEQSPQLLQRSETYRSSIVVPASASFYKVLSAEAYSKHGLNAHGIIFDELHAQPDRELWDVLTTATAARRQPLVVALTTAGWDRNSICWEQHEYAERVRDGIIEDPEFLPVLYNAEGPGGRQLDWQSPEAWAKACPSLGITVQPEFLAALCQRAQETPGFQNTFRRLYLNEWTQQANRWLNMTTWDECAGTASPLEGPLEPGVPLDSLQGKRCFAGLDLSSTTDVSSFVLVFPDGGHVDVLAWHWIPAESSESRAEKDRVPFPVWIRQGHVAATEGNVVDYDVLRERINELGTLYDIQEIAIDRWNSTQLQTQLIGDGFTVVPFGQGYASMSAPSKELEKLVVSRSLRHGGNPVLRWMASNVAIETDAAGNIKPSKGKSRERIDGIVAMIMALGRMIAHAGDVSPYETRGLRVL